MKKFLAVIAIGLSPLVIATPAQADNCQSTVVGPVCVPNLPTLPGLPPVTAPVAPAPAVPPPPAPVIPNPVAPRESIPTPSAPPQTGQTPGAVVHSVPQNKAETPKEAPPAAPVDAEKQDNTPQPPEANKPVKPRTVTVAQAVSLSLASLIFGPLLALGVMYLMYRIGRREGENSVNDFLADLLALTKQEKS